MIQTVTISRDDSIYEAFPDVVLTPSGRLLCLFLECRHHADRSWTRLVLCHSDDRGETWSAKRPLAGPTEGVPWWNCGRLSRLADGRIVALADQVHREGETSSERQARNYLWFSSDNGDTWDGPHETPARGIVPDRLLELPDGRWILSCHDYTPNPAWLSQHLWYSDDQGATWSERIPAAHLPGLNLCEVSIVPVEDALVAFMRENSGRGWPCYKTISRDRGESWSAPVPFPLPGCHRPVAGWLAEGWLLITYRFMQGGKGWTGWWTQNVFAALTDSESALATNYKDAHTRIRPLDFDRSPASDLGYTGWVQFPEGDIFIVNYIVDDAPNGQIRGYRLSLDDFILPAD